MASSDVILRQRRAQPAIFAPLREPPVVAPDEPAAPKAPPPPDPEEIRAAAREAGYVDGYEVGRQAGEYGLHRQAERLRHLLDDAVHDVEEAVRQIEPKAIELALVVASRIVERELRDCPDDLREVLRSALGAAGTVRVIRVRLHPDDRPLIDADWFARVSAAAGVVEIVADPGVQSGGCVIDTAAGFVDGQPDARLEELRRQIRAGLGTAP